MEFHEKLQQLRKQKGLTQEELAQALYVSRTAVSKWESGRGYPNIDSLKALAKFFSVTVDELLSGGEVLNIAEEDSRQREKQLRTLISGTADLSALLLFVLPFFRQNAGEAVQAVPLLLLTGPAVYMRAAYYAITAAMILWGVLTLLRSGSGHLLRQRGQWISLLLHTVGLLLFILGSQPYAAVYLLALLAVKLFLTVKSRHQRSQMR
ncbi:MAG: helix-turn-helix transcriptional regulator [Oscillospiraceae bacterium]|nr:helix-turn-helix transcriptional regulator [Oscillospiraceae bacterium]